MTTSYVRAQDKEGMQINVPFWIICCTLKDQLKRKFMEGLQACQRLPATQMDREMSIHPSCL